MKKMIMMDFDGTLLDAQSSALLPEFTNKIIQLTDKGMLFAVNSARPYSSLKRLLAPLESRTIFICNDGAQIMYKNCLIYKAALPREAARKICAAAVARGITVLAALREQNVHADPEIVQNKNFFGEDVYKIILLKNDADRAAAAEVKTLALNLGMKLCYEDKDYTEFSRADVNKGTACALLCQKYQVQGGLYAFGDSGFDLPMFEKADYKFLMQASKISLPGATVIENAQRYIIENF